MRKNLYTKTINDIKISENAVNSAIENIYSKQSNDNIIDIKKSKNKKVKRKNGKNLHIMQVLPIFHTKFPVLL